MLLNNIPLTQFIRFRLQNKLVLSFILVLLIPSLFISMYTANQSSRYVLDATRMNQLERLRTKAAAIEQKLEDLQ